MVVEPILDDGKVRCGWCLGSQIYRDYHDKEWGIPVHDDLKLFELLTLEGAQAGLSWITILNRREGYRRVFEGFDPAKVASYNSEDVERMMQDAGIIRNRLKVFSTIVNAKAFLLIQDQFGTFDRYIWQFVDGETLVNYWRKLAEIPATTGISDSLSKDLKKRGFKFVGSTIMYAMMQASGMVNDHLIDCHCR